MFTQEDVDRVTAEQRQERSDDTNHLVNGQSEEL